MTDRADLLNKLGAVIAGAASLLIGLNRTR